MTIEVKFWNEEAIGISFTATPFYTETEMTIKQATELRSQLDAALSLACNYPQDNEEVVK